ncbi:hypothetical protein ACIRBX_29865 [Kitasatospora sp. NPDC096147]|uniref:hypothetical protein n=1 Tax=Kitasatospora sp. NPDC096147 TaxID=3364093 RepID=UPI0037FBBBAB
MSSYRRVLAVTTVLAAALPAQAAVAAQHDTVTAACTADLLSTATPTLTGTTTGTAARFGLWDLTADRKLVDRQVAAADGALAVTTDPLTDGHRYEWRFWPQGGGKPTAKCGFGVDTTPPAVPTVSSTDFPASTSGQTALKYAGQYGTFTLASEGAVCYQYSLGSLSVGWNCQSPGAATGPTVQVRPTYWGTNVLTVQAVDAAGNVSQPASYTFYAPSNPNPVSAPGDVDGDAVPDILVPDAAGNLQVISTDRSDTTPTSVVRASQAPDGVSWASAETVSRGYDNHAPNADLLAISPGGTYLYLFQNVDYGAFATGSTLVRGSRPATRPEGVAADWSATTQLIGLGRLGTRTSSSLLAVEGDDLVLLTDPGVQYRYRTVTKLSTGGAWAGHRLIEPATAPDGSLTVRARELATGELREYAVPKAADGTYDFSALASPANGTVAGTFPVAQYPTLRSTADGNLYAVTAERHLVVFTGTTAPKDRGLLR